MSRGFCRRLLATLVAGLLTTATVAAQDTLRTYTTEHPLVYEDAWDLWPYSFLNENGEPDGFNIDLIRMLMNEMKLPYVIKLKPADEAFHDLRNGKSDLTLGLAAGFHDEYGQYSTNAVTLFTQSVVTPKSQKLEIKNFRDLGRHRVIVKDSSLCHHLMIDYGWGGNAVPVEDVREAIQELSNTEEGQIVWNTLSLKWLMRRYQIENLELTPVNMPHGEYKFMSNDTRLLKQLDDTYARLYSAEVFTPIQNKWFYPEQEQIEETTPAWVWYAIGIALTLLFIAAVYAVIERLQIASLNKHNRRLNKRLALIIETCQVRVWTYHVEAQQFTRHNENGQPAYHYTKEEFAQRYAPDDFRRIMQAIDQLLVTREAAEGEAEKEVTLHIRANDIEDSDSGIRDFTVTLSVLRRSQDGTPLTIIGMKKDVTEELERKRLADERTLRYWAIFRTNMAGMIYFDRQGCLTDINPMACELFHCGHDDIIARHVLIGSFFDIGDSDLGQVDDYHASLVQDGRYLEVRLKPVRNDREELMGVFAICRDISDHVSSVHAQQASNARLGALRSVLREYETDINGVLNESDVRLVAYSPANHTLTIYRQTGEAQHALTQTRCMTLVDDRSKKMAMRLLADMDAHTRKDIYADVWTTLRAKGGCQLCLTFYLSPRFDANGRPVEYLGLCRDFSELRDIEQRTEQETAKVQEVENTKNSFVKNMVQEIRQPMNTIMDYATQFDPQAPTADEPALSKGIMDNADKLLHLIDNILYLSRLEAHMVEFLRRPCNFAELFEAHCASGWARFQNGATKYIVENPYEQLVVDIDPDSLEHAISQITANAAKHTTSGTVRARYDYIAQRLVISIDDTGDGIAPDVLDNINNQETQTNQTVRGLGLLICRELMHQMNGTLEVSSEPGSGTTVYMTLPCHATTIKRKKTLS